MTSQSPPPCLLTPRPGHVIVERDKPEGQSKAGIIIPTTAQGKPNTGLVIAAPAEGEGADFPIGVRVLFPEYVGIDVNVNDTPLTILRLEEILATFRTS